MNTTGNICVGNFVEVHMRQTRNGPLTLCWVVTEIDDQGRMMPMIFSQRCKHSLAFTCSNVIP